MADIIETRFKASLDGETKKNFETLQQGLKKIALEIQNIAKAATTLQSKDIAKYFSNISSSTNTFAVNLQKMAKESLSSGKSVDSLSTKVSLYTKNLAQASQVKFNKGPIDAINQLGQQVEYANNRVTLFIPSIQSLATSLEQTTTPQKDLANITTSWVSGIESAALANQSLVNAQKDVTTYIQKANEEAIKWLNLLGLEPAQINNVNSALEQLNRNKNNEISISQKVQASYNFLAQQYYTLINTLSNYGQQIQKVIASLNQEGKAIDQVKGKVAQLDQAHQTAYTSMEKASGGIGSLVQNLSSYAKGMAVTTLVNKLREALGFATDEIIEQDQSLYNLQATMQASSTEMAGMNDAIIQAASNTKFSLSEVTDAMILFGQQGFTASESMSGIPEVAGLAAGSFESLKTIVEVTTAAVKIFHLGMDQTGSVADIFANAIENSRVRMGQLNDGLNSVGPLAKSSGMSLKETTATMMLLANAGLQSSNMSIGLKQVLSQLVNPTQAFKTAVLAAGYSMNDFNPSATSFKDIINNLPNVFSNAQQSIHTFGVHGSEVISAFASSGASSFDQLISTLDRQGTAVGIASKQMNGLGVIISGIATKFATIARQLGQSSLTTWLKEAINLFGSFLDSIITFLNTGLGKFIIEAGVTASAVGSIIFVLSNFATLVKATIIPVIVSLSKVLIAFAATPVGAAIIGIGIALGGATYLWNDYKDKVDKTIKSEAAYSAKIKDVQSKLQAYNKIVQEKGKFSKEASEAGLNLKKSIENIGTSTNKNAKFVREFGSAIDKDTGVINDLTSYSKNLSQTLDTELGQSYLKSAKEAENFYHRHSTLSGSISDTSSWNFMTSGIESTTEAFIQFQSAAQNNPELAEHYRSISDAAQNAASQILQTADASQLTSSSAKEMVAEYAKANEIGPLLEEAIYRNLVNMVIATNDAATSYSGLQTSVSATFANINKEYQQLNTTQQSGFEEKVQKLEQGIELVREAAEQESAARISEYMNEVENFSGTAEQKAQLAQTLKEQLQEIAQDGHNAEVELNKTKIALINQQYSEQLQNIGLYYEQQKELVSTNYATDVELEKQKYTEKANALNTHLTDEAEKYQQQNELYIQSQQELLNSKIAHYNELGQLSDDNYNKQIQATQLILGNETDISNRIQELIVSRLTAQKDNLLQRQEAYVSAINTMQSKETELTNKIAAELQSRESFTASIEESIRNLSYKTMTEKEVYEAKMTYAQQLASEAREALLCGEFETAKTKAKEAQTAYTDAANSIDKNSETAVSYAEKISNIQTEFKGLADINSTASNSIIGGLEQQKKGVQNYIVELQNSVKSTQTSVASMIQEIDKIGSAKITIDTQDTLNAFENVKESLRKLREDAENQDNKLIIKAYLEGSSMKPFSEKIQEMKGELASLIDQEKSPKYVITMMGNDGAQEKTLSQFIKDIINNINDLLGTFDKLNKSWEPKIATTSLDTAIGLIDKIKNALKLISETQWQINIKTSGLSNLTSATSYWNNLLSSDSNITKTIQINTVRTETSSYSNDSSGAITASTGTKLPGYGGGDKIPAMLEAGEWVIRKEAVKKYGDNYLEMLNNMELNTPSDLVSMYKNPFKTQRFAKGGLVTPTEKPKKPKTKAEKEKEEKEKAKAAAKEKEEKERLKNPKNKSSDIFGVKNLNEVVFDQVISAYRDSGEITDLYQAVNQVANYLDTFAVNSYLSKGAAMGGWTTLNVAQLAMSIPRLKNPISVGYYKSKGNEEPNDHELHTIKHITDKAMWHKAWTGQKVTVASKSLDKLASIYKKAIKGYSIDKLRDKFKFGTGGNVSEKIKEILMPNVPDKALNSINKNIPSDNFFNNPLNEPTHKVNFNIDGKNIGTLSGDGLTVNKFMKQLKQHRLRS